MYQVDFTVGIRKDKRSFWRVLVRLVSGPRGSGTPRDGEIPIRITLKIPNEVLDGRRVVIEVPVSAGEVEGAAR